MPLPNEHAARISQPIQDGIFARKEIAPGISVILQKPKSKPEASMQVQSYRFGKHQFTAGEARSWLKTHNIKYISFEPAISGKESQIELLKYITNSLSRVLVGETQS